jgi:hypothetical protein
MECECIYNCKNCKLLERKIQIYEKCLKDIHEIDQEMIGELEASILIDQNYDQKIKSNLSESFIVIDEGKKLVELNKKEQYAINEQNNLHNYIKATTYADKANTIYGKISYVLSFGNWIALL